MFFFISQKMATRGNGVVYHCKRGAPRRKITSVICNGAKRLKTVYLKDSIDSRVGSRLSNEDDRESELTAGVHHEPNDFDLLFGQQTQASVNIAETYAEKRCAVNDDWLGVQEEMLKGFVESCNAGTCCTMCSNEIEFPRITCEDCGPQTVFCVGCCEKIHSIVRFHVPLIWLVCIHKMGHFIAILGIFSQCSCHTQVCY